VAFSNSTTQSSLATSSRGLANCRVQLDIDRKKTPPSQQQSAYLFAAVYSPIAEHTGYAVMECHEICKKLFLAPRQLTVGDRTVVVAGSTTRLTTSEMPSTSIELSVWHTNWAALS
jgi:hypothetical protein